MATIKAVVLHILENENETSRCLGRLSCDGVANLGEFRAFLEGFKEQPIVPWPFKFWDLKLNSRIASELEQTNTLELHDHVVTVIRSHGGQSMAGKESMAITEPTTVEESSKVGLISLTCDRNEAFPRISSLSMGLVACAPISSSHEQDLQGETSCVKLEPKDTIFLSHSGIQKPFVEQLCKDLEAQNHYPFFDQRSSSLPKGEKFSSLIIDAAKNCQVAVVVLSREYLSSKWPMLELVEFVHARRSVNKSLKLLPLFYKASVGDLSDESIHNQWMRKWVELVGGDSRVDLEQWVAAVQELRGVNGLSFDKFGNSEVSYRDAIVKEIFSLAPPDLLFETSNICGCDRICKMLAGMFLPHTSTSAQVLGLYGMGGLGKTTMSKCLCNHFNKQFSGRVCYIEIKEEVKVLERQQMVMRKLLRLNDLLLQNVCDVSEGWGLLQSRMEKDPVFLVIDNVQFDGASEEEARAYLNLVYNSGSKILVISRSSDVVEDLLGEARYCCQIPCLTMDEAAGVFLQYGAPVMDYSSLTGDERRVVDICLEEAWFSHQGPWYRNGAGHFHPLALRAFGVYLHERSKSSDVLSWNTYLHEYGKLKGTRESYKRMFKILGLQFNTFDRVTQLMFLDTSLYASKALESDMLSNSPLEELIGWLANVHGELTEVVRSKIFDFKKFDMINIEGEKIIIHDLYKEYAIWFLGQINHEDVRGVWCVGKCGELVSSLPLELQDTPPGRCWPYLKRIRLENMWCDGFPVGKVQEWCNVVVLQILRCENVTTINLQGLTCLRHLELKYLKNLKTLTFTGDGSSSTNNVLPPLQFLTIDGLSSLECLPSFSPFTSLKFLEVVGSEGLTQPPSFQHCSSLERMWLSWYPNQKTLPSLYGLTSLRDLTILNTGFESYKGRALKLEGLSSLISLGALELYNIPVGDLSGLENLTRVEYIYLSDMRYLTCLPPLNNLARSSLHVLEMWGWKRMAKRLDELKSLIKLKLEGLAARGEIVPHTPSKIWPRMRRIRFADEQMSRQGDSSCQGHYPSISNLASVKFDAGTELQRDEQMSRQGERSRQGHRPSISNSMSVKRGVKRLQRSDSPIDSATGSSDEFDSTMAAMNLHDTTSLQLQQLQQQQQSNFLQSAGVRKHPTFEAGGCARLLMQYLYHQRHRPPDNNIAFWRNFVGKYFAPNAKERWCFSLYGHQATGIYPQDIWHCEICGTIPGLGFESTVEVLPRLSKDKFDSGIQEELLFVDLPHEYRQASGYMVLEYDKAIHESVFEQKRLVREGHLRIVFSLELKILSWEFCARSHEVLSRQLIIRPQLAQISQEHQSSQKGGEGVSDQDLQTNNHLWSRDLSEIGFTKRYMRFLQMSEIFSNMKDLIDFSRDNNVGPLASLHEFPRRSDGSSRTMLRNSQMVDLSETVAETGSIC